MSIDRNLVKKLDEFLSSNGEVCPICGANRENEEHSRSDSVCLLKDYITFLPKNLKKGDWIGLAGYEWYEYYPCIVTKIDDSRHCQAYEPSIHKEHHLSAGEFSELNQKENDKLNKKYSKVYDELKYILK